MHKDITTTAGIDTSKATLDIAVHGRSERWQVGSTLSGWRTLATDLADVGVGRIGIEATGGYERGVVGHLRAGGFTILVLQPIQVGAYARVRLRRAKNDALDAAPIAACTANLEPPAIEPDARLADLTQHLTFVEQLEEDIVRLKIRLERIDDWRLRRLFTNVIARLKERRNTELRRIASRLRADSPTIIEDATLIADALVVVTGQEKDPHWNESARNFIEGLILHVATEPAYEGRRNLLTVRGLVNCALMRAPGGDKDDEEEDDEGPADFAVKSEMLANARRIAESLGDEDLAGALEGAARDFYDKRETEQAGVLSTVRRHTKFLDYKAMRRVLEGDDFDLADLKGDPRGVMVYLCLPAGRMGPCNRWLRLFLNQLLDAAEQEQTRPGTPKVLVCLDEFPVLGFMSQLQDAAGQVASFNLRLWIVIQDWGQGKTLYGERWESFAANAGILQAFGNADLATTEYLSRRLGKTPVEVTRVGEVSLQQTD